ncbi:MAG: macro domain-containing protein [Phycisphaerae bacterium]
MLKIIQGDIFSSTAQTLVNTVNCVGVMGKGLALEFKNRFPLMFDDYRRRCKEGQVQIGQPYLYTASQPWILNFPTKLHWRNNSKIEYITAGLNFFIANYSTWNITSIAFPLLGANLGGLDKSLVLDVMTQHLEKLDIPVEIRFLKK